MKSPLFCIARKVRLKQHICALSFIEEIEAALAELPEVQRTVFIQTELLDLPVKAISQTSGVAVNTPLSRKHYAVVHLRKRLRDLYTELL